MVKQNWKQKSIEKVPRDSMKQINWAHKDMALGIP